jgi:hypothetical protein
MSKLHWEAAEDDLASARATMKGVEPVLHGFASFHDVQYYLQHAHAQATLHLAEMVERVADLIEGGEVTIHVVIEEE